MAIKSVSIRIDEEMLNKLHVVADYEGRSANSQVLILIRNCIEAFEKNTARSDSNSKRCAGAHLLLFSCRVYSIPNRRRALAVVISPASSGETPLISAIFAATSGTRRLSLRLPRCGSGAI